MGNDKEALLEAIAPLLEVVRHLDLEDPAAARRALEEELPPSGALVKRVGELLRAGVSAQTLCTRENAGVRFERLHKPVAGELSVDAVHMGGDGPGHLHPRGEVDLCFAVDGAPRFCGHAPGWTVYPPGSWHVPSVAGGAMDIVYFLPGGAIDFGPPPAKR